MYNEILFFPSVVMGRLYCRLKGVRFGANLRTFGMPLIHRHRSAEIVLGNDVVLTSSSRVNLTGVRGQVILAAPNPSSRITIGNNSGLSGAVIYAASSVTIGDHVNIGVNVRIYDSDVHPIDYNDRRAGAKDRVASQPVILEDDVWIGADAIILKGVRIGQAAIVGAGSVVAQDIPPFTVWAGNPARHIKDITHEDRTLRT